MSVLSLRTPQPNLAGQDQYWQISAANVLDLDPSLGSSFPGYEQLGPLRVFGLVANRLLAANEQGRFCEMTLPLPDTSVEYEDFIGMRVAPGGLATVLRFRNYKPEKGKEFREQIPRRLAVIGVGFGEHSGHIGEPPGPYWIGHLIGECGRGKRLATRDIRNFPFSRAGMFGDPNDPQKGESIRQRWGLPYIPEKPEK